MRHVSIQQLSAFVDGALSGVSRELVARHLAACAQCRDRHQAWKVTSDGLHQALAWVPDERILDELSSRIEMTLTAERKGLPVPQFAPLLPPIVAASPPAPTGHAPARPSGPYPKPGPAAQPGNPPASSWIGASRPVKSGPPPQVWQPSGQYPQPTPSGARHTPLPQAPTPPAPAPAQAAPQQRPAPPPPAPRPAPVQASPPPPPPAPRPAPVQASPPPPPPAPRPTPVQASPPPPPPAPPRPAPVQAVAPPPPPPPPPPAQVATRHTPLPPAPPAPSPPYASQPYTPPPPPLPPPTPRAMEYAQEVAEAVAASEAPTRAPVVAPRRPAPIRRKPASPPAPAYPTVLEQRDGPRSTALVFGAIALVLIALAYLPDVIRIPLPEHFRPRVPKVEFVKRGKDARRQRPAQAQAELASRTPVVTTPVPQVPVPVDSAAAKSEAAVAPTDSVPPQADAASTAKPLAESSEKPKRAKARKPPPEPEPEPEPVPEEETARDRPATFIPSRVTTTVELARPPAESSKPPAPEKPASEETPVPGGAGSPPATESEKDPAWPLLCVEVVDAKGAPMEGVRVDLVEPPLTVRTDKRGRFCLSCPPGPRTLHVAHAGFTPATRDVNLSGLMVEARIVLARAE